MSLISQLLLGSIFLGVCSVFHVLALSFSIPLLIRLRSKIRHRGLGLRITVPVLLVLAFIVGSHTVQVWLWAFYWLYSPAIADWNSAIYFSMVTYTTLGYGDIVLEPGLRVLGTMEAVTGLLAFGISTAFLVGMLTRILPHSISRQHPE